VPFARNTGPPAPWPFGAVAPAPALKRIDAATAWIAARGSASATNGVPRDTPRATGEKEIDPVLRVDDDRALRIYGSVRMVFYS
jgi:hypothetical protein